MNLHINNDLNYPSPFCEPNASSFGINKRGNFSFSFLVVFFFPQSPSFLSSSLPPPAPPLSFRKTTAGHKFLNQCSRSPAAEQCRPSWEVTCHVPNLPGMTAALGWKKSFPLASVLLQGHLADQWPSSPRFNALCRHDSCPFASPENGHDDQGIQSMWSRIRGSLTMLTLSLRRPIALGSNSLSLHLISCVTAGSLLISICVAYSVWVFFFKYLFIYLAALGLSCDTWDPVPWAGMEPQAPCIGSTES